MSDPRLYMHFLPPNEPEGCRQAAARLPASSIASHLKGLAAEESRLGHVTSEAIMLRAAKIVEEWAEMIERDEMNDGWPDPERPD